MDNYSYTSVMLRDIQAAVEGRNEACVCKWTAALNNNRSVSICVREMVQENALMLRLELVRFVREDGELSETGKEFYLKPDGHHFKNFDKEFDYVKGLSEDLDEMRAYIDAMVDSIMEGERSSRSKEDWETFFLDHFVEGLDCAKYSDENHIGLLELCLALGMGVNRTRHLLIRVLGDGDLNFKDVQDIVWAYGLQAHISHDEVCRLITWAKDEMAAGVKKHKMPLTERMEEADRRYELTQKLIDKFSGDDDPFSEMGEFCSETAFKNWLMPMLPDLKSANGGSRTATLVYRWLMSYWYELVQKKEKGEKCPDLEDDLYTAVFADPNKGKGKESEIVGSLLQEVLSNSTKLKKEEAKVVWDMLSTALTSPVKFKGKEIELLEKLLPQEAEDITERELLFGTVTVAAGNASVHFPAEEYARSHYKYLKELMTGDRPVKKRDLLLLVFFICSEVWDKNMSAKDRWELFYNVARNHVLPAALMTDFYLPAPAERSISLAICNKDPQYAYYLLQTILAVDPILEAEAEKKLETADGKREYEKQPETKEAKDARDWDRENWLQPIAKQTWQEWDYYGFDKKLADFLKKRFRTTGDDSIKFELDSKGFKLYEVEPEVRVDFPAALRALIEAPAKHELKCTSEGCDGVLDRSNKRLFDAKKKDIPKKKMKKGAFCCVKCLAKLLGCSEDSLREDSIALEEANAGLGLTERARTRYLFAYKLKLAVLGHFRKGEMKCRLNTEVGFTMTFEDATKKKRHVIMRELEE